VSAHKYLPFGDGSVHLAHGGPTTLPTVPPPLGDGTACLLLHAAGGSAGAWRPLVDAIGPTRPWAALDLPAHGRSGGVAGPAGMEAVAELVGATLSWLGRRPVVIVGWGLGGAAALAAAGRGAAGVIGLVLVGTAAPFAVPDELLAVLGDVVRGRRPQHFGTEGFAPTTGLDVMKIAWTEQVQTDPRVWLSDLELLARLDVPALARGVRLPTLVVTGASDRFAPPDGARALATTLADARVEIVEDAGHHLPIEQPARLATLVAGFVETLG
jgi:pimeloyl-ACP methyl ester carboxylesterase